MLETVQENNQTFKTPIMSVTANLYNADAEQRVGLTLKYQNSHGKTIKSAVAHIFRGMTDEEFFQYEAKKQIVQKISGTDVLDVRTEDKNLEAAGWLWGILAVRRDGYVERADWREKTNLLDKQTAIEKGLLLVFVANEDESDPFAEQLEADLFEGAFNDDVVSIVRLDCLFNQSPITTTHQFRQPSAQDVGDYERTMRKASNRINSRNGFRQKKNNQTAEISIPSKARELCALYDRLIEQTEGYTGRVPAHHKREAVLELFSRDADVTEKN